MANPISVNNLLPPRWLPGESGNPNGKPKGSQNASTALKALLKQLAPDDMLDQEFVRTIAKQIKSRPITIADAVACRMIHKAVYEGDVKAASLIFDRTEGKAAQTINVNAGENVDRIVAIVGVWLHQLKEALEGDTVEAQVIEEQVKRLCEPNNIDPALVLAKIEMPSNEPPIIDVEAIVEP